jgi:hypothetical protein
MRLLHHNDNRSPVILLYITWLIVIAHTRDNVTFIVVGYKFPSNCLLISRRDHALGILFHVTLR